MMIILAPQNLVKIYEIAEGSIVVAHYDQERLEISELIMSKARALELADAIRKVVSEAE